MAAQLRYAFKLPGQPEEVHLELTNHCNLRCAMCGVPDMKRTRGMMSTETFKKALGECRAAGVKVVNLHFYGESTLHPKLLEYAGQCSGFKVQIDTNALFVTPELARRLTQLNVAVTVSIHGLTHEDYARVHRVEGFDAAVKGVKTLRAAGASVTIQVMNFDLTNYTEEYIRRRCRELFGDTPLSLSECTYVPGSPEDHRRVKTPLKRGKPCRYLTRSLAVLWDGRVTVCCTDYEGLLVIGHINDGLMNLWDGEKHSSMQRDHLFGRYRGICAICDP